MGVPGMLPYAEFLAKKSNFDWYQTTVHLGHEKTLELLRPKYPECDQKGVGGINGYTSGIGFFCGERQKLGMYFGGNPHTNIKSTSSDAIKLHEVLTGLGIPHSPTRIDSAVDLHAPGLFTTLSRRLIRFAKRERLAISQQGDWSRGLGRTLYVGASSSAVRLVIYEKGYEQGLIGEVEGAENWVRIEVRLKPHRQKRADIACFTPEDCFKSGFVPDAMGAMFRCKASDSISVGTVYSRSDSDRARRALLKQYKKVLTEWAVEAGSWEDLGVQLGTHLDDGVQDRNKETAKAGG